MPFWSVNCNIYIPADSSPSHGSAKNLHNSSVFWLNMVSWKMLRFAWGCNPCSVSVLETSRIDSASFSFVSIHSFARTWPVFTSKDSEPSSQGHCCWLRMLSNPTPPHPHVDTKQVSGVASQWRSKCNVRYYPTPPHPHVVTKQVSGVASQWRSKCNVRYYPTPPHAHPKSWSGKQSASIYIPAEALPREALPACENDQKYYVLTARSQFLHSKPIKKKFRLLWEWQTFHHFSLKKGNRNFFSHWRS